MTKTALPPRSRTYKGVSLEERANSRKQRFLVAGKAVFGDLGFQGANVKDVCAAAGLTERYYYEAFGSLQKLFEAVYLEALDRLRQVFDDAASQSPEDPGTQLRLTIYSYFELLKSDRNLARILIIEIYSAAPAITHLYERGVRQFAARLEKLVARTQELATRLIAACLRLRWSARRLLWRCTGALAATKSRSP